MLRWIPPGLAVALALLGLFNVARVPEWLPWRLGVLTGEFGHWVALLALALAVGAWWLPRTGTGLAALAPALTTAAAAAIASALLLTPGFQAAAIARELPARVEGAFGGGAVARVPFAWGGLFGHAPAPAAVETMTFAGELALDFYRPAAAGRRREGAAPCVIVVHGGGWDAGDRTQFGAFNRWLAGRGYAVAAISYRLAPKFRWPAQRDDLLAAIAFLKGRARELGIDPARLVLFGRSAGGQIAQATAYTAHDPAIRGVIALYAPSDLVFGYINTHENDAIRSPALMRQYLGGTPDSARANYESASALNHVGRASPPTLLVHGLHDALVWHRHSVRLDAKLAEHGVPRVFVSLPWATHAFDFNLHGPGGQLTTFAVEGFLAGVTR